MATTTKIDAMTTLKKAILAATTLLLAGAGIHETAQAWHLRTQTRMLLQQQAPLAAQIAALKAENERLSNQLAQLRKADVMTPAQRHELLRLRAQITMAHADTREITRLKTALAEQNGKLPDFLISQMVWAMEIEKKRARKSALAELTRTKERLHLTEEQVLAVSNVLMLRIEQKPQLVFDLVTHAATSNQMAQAARTMDQQENDLKALLSPEQLAAYNEYRQQEKTSKTEDSARSEAGNLAEDLKLSNDQQERLRARLYEINLNKPPDPLDLRGVIEAARNSQPAAAYRTALDLRRSQLDDKLGRLADILTPEQINAYREEQLAELDADAAITRLMMPQPAAGMK